MHHAGRRCRPYLWLCALVALLGAAHLVYSQTLAFTWDEGFHLLASQLILAGKKPYLDFCFPQTTWNTYCVAACMWVFGQSWRVAHALQALLTAGAVMLAVDFVYTRAPESRWRTPAAMAAALLAGLNAVLLEHATVGQAYGMCLFAGVAAFRAAAAARGKQGMAFPLLAGFLAGMAAASSLLDAAVLPVLLGSFVLEKRWKSVAAFCAGAAMPFLPTLWLFVQAPGPAWFNLAGYQTHYRITSYPDAGQHDFEVLSSWLDSGHALLLLLLAAAGWLAIRRGVEWRSAPRAEFYLAGALAAALALEAAVAHPTFEQYFLLAVPFAAILAAAGFQGLCLRLAGSVRVGWPTGILALLIVLGCGKSLYDRRDVYLWSEIEQVAGKVQQVTPPGAPIWTDESIYFLTRRLPPSGMEFSYSHRISDLKPELAAQLHIVPDAEIKRRVEAGTYATVETCDLDTDFIDSLDLAKRYRQSSEMHDCGVYWDRAPR
ncbi:MAG TPA: glycosyltransferase 87 family protein [Bryobacteraceae bacterium]|nr:glycosyltransferase 87 family protein [Bryobacteraceae bacterium]